MQVPDLAHVKGLVVRSSEGTELGTIGAVHVQRDGRQPLLVEFPADSDTPYVAPLFGAALDATGLVLAYAEELVRSGPTVDADADLSAGDVGYIIGHYLPGFRLGPDQPITARVREIGDVGAPGGGVHTVPGIVGDDELPPIVVIRPGYQGEHDR